MSLDLIVSAVARELDIPSLAINEHGVCSFVVDGRLEINLEQGVLDDSLHLYATVGRQPAGGLETFYAMLLEAQLFGKEVGSGMAFGLDKATGEILLGHKLRLSSLSEEAFLPLLEEFLNWAEHWTERLSGMQEDTLPTTELEGLGHFIRA